MHAGEQTNTNTRAILAALAAAALFGASTPFAKQLVGELPALLLAGLLYLGAGFGLLLARLIRDRGWTSPRLSKQEWPWLLGTVAFGGILGPVLLMTGLATTAAASAALLLNLETVLTALLAWILFRENAGRRVVLGMLLIVAGGLVLSWPQTQGASSGLGSLCIAGACLCWAIDNNLTRTLSASDVLFIAGSKGSIAGLVNTSLAVALGATLPSWQFAVPTLAIGFVGYGVSLALFVLALRDLGSARTGAYFATAPFIGAAMAVVFFEEATSAGFWIAAALMAGGVWLHLTERHEHLHRHDALAHGHPHVHDEHHRHEHDFPWDGTEPHTHPHRHNPLEHRHPHYPDVHHRHSH